MKPIDWNARALVYDRLAWAHDPGLLGWVEQAFLDALGGLGADEPADARCHVLEIGCGTGALTARLAQHLPPGSMVACDVSTEMIRIARERTGSHRARFVHASDADVGLVASGYRAVVGRMVLHHVPDPPSAAIRRWAGMLASPGAIVIAEGVPVVADDRHPSTDLFRAAFALKEPGRHVFHAHQIAGWMLDAGASSIEVRECWTLDNSLANWLDGNDLEPWRRLAIEEIHREAPTEAWNAYRMRRDGNDLRMRWRHAVVTGWFDGEPREGG